MNIAIACLEMRRYGLLQDHEVDRVPAGHEDHLDGLPKHEEAGSMAIQLCLPLTHRC